MTQEMVKVKVKQAVAWDGVSVSPDRSGRKVTPIEALVPRSVALAHGPGDLEIIGEPAPAPKGAEEPKTPPPAPPAPAAPAQKQAATPKDKQARPANDK